MPNSKNDDPDTLAHFETQLERLQEIVKSLDDPSVPLAEMLVLYREGVILTQLCHKMLDSASQQVIEIATCAESDE